jgi:hypothetical protein
MSSSVLPARSSALRTAGTGPIPIVLGSTPQTAYETIRARTGAPSSCARCPDMTTTAAAASLTPEALPAVTAPSFLKAGLSFAKSPSVASRRRCSSTLNSVVPTRVLSSIDTTSSSNRPVSIAA